MNLYVRFKKLFKTDIIQAGHVVSVGEYACLVSLLGGGVIRVNGTADLGKFVIIKNGKIDVVLDALPAYIVNI